MAYCSKCGVPVEGEFCTQCGAPATSGAAPGGPVQQSPAGSPPLQPASSVSSAAAPKKRGPLFWVLVGCSGLVVIFAIVILAVILFGVRLAERAGVDAELMKTNPALAAAKMLAATNPDVEVVSIDEDKGIIRVRNKKTGKTMMMNLADLQKGKITFVDDQGQEIEMQVKGEGDHASLEVKGPEGTLQMGSPGADRLPDWLPGYPGAEGSGTLEMSGADKKAGSLIFKTSDSAEDVVAFYENALKNAGFDVEKKTTQIPSQSSLIVLEARQNSENRIARILVSGGREGIAGSAGTTISLTFESGK